MVPLIEIFMPTTRSQARKAAVIMSLNEDVKRYLKELLDPLARKEDIDTAINTAVKQRRTKNYQNVRRPRSKDKRPAATTRSIGRKPESEPSSL